MTRIAVLPRKLGPFVTRRREAGMSYPRIVLVALPLWLVLQFYLVVTRQVNAHVLMPLVSVPRFKRFQQDSPGIPGTHFYMIVMPRTLHFISVSLRLVPKHVRVTLLLNGVAAWEEAHLRREFADHAIVRLCTCPRSSLPHGAVLDLLIDHSQTDFGILDHDFFVLNPALFDSLQPTESTFALGVFRLRNSRADLEFPTTHFLFLHVPVVQAIKRKYRISANEYHKIPRQFEPFLANIRLGRDNCLKEYLDYFDAMNMLFALALHDGYGFQFPDLCADDVYHVGATSGRCANNRFSNYAGLRFLELADNSELTARYGSLYEGAGETTRRGNSGPAGNKLSLTGVASLERALARIKERLIAC
jgi:hypothetical protein